LAGTIQRAGYFPVTGIYRSDDLWESHEHRSFPVTGYTHR